jgi:hypothetical protein
VPGLEHIPENGIILSELIGSIFPVGAEIFRASACGKEKREEEPIGSAK